MKASFSSDALIPRLRKKPYRHLNNDLDSVFTHIKPEEDSQDQQKVKLILPLVKVLVSDFEEIGERGRFLKYNSILARAEAAFTQKKREERDIL